MKHQDAPGTTFKKHMAIAQGLLSEDDFLLTEILFNPNTPQQLKQIQEKLAELLSIVNKKDSKAMLGFLTKVRENIV
jgi:prephenate dehydrogenase